MQSTFSGIEMGKRGLTSHTVGLQTVGHNVSNASTEGYSRQRVELRATDALYLPGLNREETPGQIGQGAEVSRIERVRDELLEGRIIGQAHGEGYWSTRDRYLLMLEKTYNEPSDVSLRSVMDKFWEGWQDLSLHPGEMASRNAVLQRGESLMDSIHERYNSLVQTRDMLESEAQVQVGEINSILKDIASLNEQIVKIKAMGDSPNDLMDRRDLLVEKLSGYLPITVDRRDPDEFAIHTGGRHLVQGRQTHLLDAVPDPANEGYSTIRWKENQEEFVLRGGKLGATIELRDVDIRDEIQKLDTMTMNFVDMVNEIHRNAYGLNKTTGKDFFTEYPAVLNLSGNYDRNGDGAYDSSYVFRMNGANRLNPQEQIGIAGTMVLSGPKGNVEVPYYAVDTVSDVVARINDAGAEVVARLDREGRLELKATTSRERSNPDFVVRHVEDSGHFLAGYAGLLQGSGPAAAYDWGRPDAVLALRGGGTDFAVAPLSHPSGWVEVSRDLLQDPASVAASFGEAGRPGETGEGSAALAIAGLRNGQVMIGRMTTFDNYFADTVADIGLKGEKAQIAMDTQERIMKDLRDTRDSISGVNIDEEMAQMVKFQHGYAAVARFISEFTKMIDTIINRVGA